MVVLVVWLLPSWIRLRLLVIQVLVMVFVTVTDFSNNVLWMVTKWNYQMVGLVLQVMFGKHVKTTILSMWNSLVMLSLRAMKMVALSQLIRMLKSFVPYLMMCRKLVIRMVWLTTFAFGMLKFLKNVSWITQLWKHAVVWKILLPFFIQTIQQLKVKNCVWFKSTSWQVPVSKQSLNHISRWACHWKISTKKYLFTSMIRTLRLHQLNSCVSSLMNMVFHGKMLGMRLLKLWATLTTLFFKKPLKNGINSSSNVSFHVFTKLSWKSTTVTSLKWLVVVLLQMLSNAHVSLRITKFTWLTWLSLVVTQSTGLPNFIQNSLKKIPSTISILFILKNSITRQMVSFNVVGHKLQLQNFQQQLMTWLVTVGVTTSMSLKILQLTWMTRKSWTSSIKLRRLLNNVWQTTSKKQQA